MEFLNKYNLTVGKVVKVVCIGLGAIILLALAASIAKLPFKSVSQIGGFGGSAPMASSYDTAQNSYSEKAYSGGTNARLSTRNVSSVIPPQTVTVGNDAESYEVTDYNAQIETRHVDEVCGQVLELKKLDYVIFENAGKSKRNCNYTFKVEHSKIQEILAVVKKLDPKNLTENTYTIKHQVDDFTSEMDILEKKRDSIDKTLESALRAYEEITSIATRTQNAEALAKIIDSKIGIIERLSQERININSTLETLSRAKVEQLDRLKYTYFSVNVYENKYFDFESLADSWKSAIQDFIRSINSVLQTVTVGLLMFLLWLLPFVIYAVVLIFLAKYGWRLVKVIWQK